MKVLFAAAGSIGSRHIRNLSAVCASKDIDLEIDVMRKSDRNLEPDLKALIRRELRDADGVSDHYDVGFITNETAQHFNSIKVFGSICRDLFIEKPVVESAGCNVNEIEPPLGSIYYVACPMRFTNYYSQIQRLVANQKVFSTRMMFSSWMPAWQPGRDYRKSFRCFANRGGGVDLDSIHEIDIMTSVFGWPKGVSRIAGYYSELQMDACDCASYLFSYADKAIEVHLDYLGKPPRRSTELLTEKGWQIVDFYNSTITDLAELTTIPYEPDDDFYQREMMYFIDLITDRAHGENINTVDCAYRNLKLAKGLL